MFDCYYYTRTQFNRIAMPLFVSFTSIWIRMMGKSNNEKKYGTLNNCTVFIAISIVVFITCLYSIFSLWLIDLIFETSTKKERK